MMNDLLMITYLAVCLFVTFLVAQSSATTVKSAEDLVNLFRGKQSTVNVEIDVKAALDFSTVSLSFPLGVKQVELVSHTVANYLVMVIQSKTSK